MITRLNGEVVDNTDYPNSFSPQFHKPRQRPGYKARWHNQLGNNKGLLITLGITLLFGSMLFLGMDVRLKAKEAEISRLNRELERYAAIGDSMVTEYNPLLTEYASCSAKLQEKKLSAKAKAHTKQQPVVAEKIKQVFGDEWAEATELYSRESSLNPLAINENGGACGLWQAYPCTKLTTKCLLSDVDCQLKTGKEYIDGRYGSVTKALAFHDEKGWY